MSQLFKKVLVGLFLKYWDIEVRGRENIRRDRTIYIANHQSYADGFVIAYQIPWIRGVAWDGFYSNPFLRYVLNWLRVVPAKNVRQLYRLLESDESLLIFPEGQRTPDGKLCALHAGAFFLARKTSTPLVPIRLDGLYESWPRCRIFPRRGKVTVTFYQPITTVTQAKFYLGGECR